MKSSFSRLQSTKAGEIGEIIVHQILKSWDLVIYRPEPGKPHLVDFLCYQPGSPLIAVEVKTYPRQYISASTGIDFEDFELYDSQCAETYIFFVDPFEEMIYFQRITILKKSAYRSGGKAYFPLKYMKPVRRLTRFEVEKIKHYSSINWNLYKKTERFFNNESKKM